MSCSRETHVYHLLTASESENRPSPWESGDGSQGAVIKEEARIQEEERVAEQEGLVEDENRFPNPSDVILESTEHDEKAFLRGLIFYLSTGRSTSSTEPGSIGRASTEYLMYDDDNEVIHTVPVSSSKHKREQRLRTPSPSSLSEYPCLYPNCGHVSSGVHNLKRHMVVHFPPTVDELHECKYEWCGRTGVYGFKRVDHRKEHMKEIEYQRMGKGGRVIS